MLATWILNLCLLPCGLDCTKQKCEKQISKWNFVYICPKGLRVSLMSSQLGNGLMSSQLGISSFDNSSVNRVCSCFGSKRENLESALVRTLPSSSVPVHTTNNCRSHCVPPLRAIASHASLEMAHPAEGLTSASSPSNPYVFSLQAEGPQKMQASSNVIPLMNPSCTVIMAVKKG